MTLESTHRKNQAWVAIDFAKSKHDVLIKLPSRKRRRAIIRNDLGDFEELAATLRSMALPVQVALEPTADYHRNLAYFLRSSGSEVRLASSIAVARSSRRSIFKFRYERPGSNAAR